VRLDAGVLVRVPLSVLDGRTGRVAIGIRPEKIRLGRSQEGENGLLGSVEETAYVGVSTQYVVGTSAGAVTVYVQNAEPGRTALAPGDVAALAWNPEATFVVDVEEEPQR
jgi:spermidine/putrescine transport system ATP-binding protein